MLDNVYNISISALVHYTLSRKKYFIFYGLIFLAISIVISLNIQKRVIVNSTIVRSNDELLDPFLIKFRAIEAFDDHHLDQLLFKKLEGIANSQEKLKELFLAVLEGQEFSIPQNKKNLIADELSKSTKVVFDHYTNQYHFAMTVLQPIDEVEKLTREFYLQLNQKTIEDFGKEISIISRDEQRKLNIKLARIKRIDEVEWAFQKLQYEESYRVAQELGLNGINSSKSVIYGAPYSMLGARILKVLVNTSKETIYFSGQYYALKAAINTLENQSFTFEGMPVFTLLGSPHMELISDKKARALVVVLGVIFGLILGTLHVLFLFVREKR